MFRRSGILLWNELAWEEHELAVELPATRAGTALAGYLHAFNSGNIGALRAYIATHFAEGGRAEHTAVQRAAMAAQLRSLTQGFDPRRIESTTEHEITVLAQARLDGHWARIELHVESEPPFRISAVTTRRMPAPADARRHGQLSEGEIVRDLTDYLEKVIAADLFSGVVLVARDGVPIYRHAAGLASVAYNVPMRPDTKLNLGSMNKMLTAVAIAQLAEQGRVALDQPIGAYLPTYPCAVADRVTVHHLLTHTSGLGSYWNERFEASRARIRTVSDMLALFVDDPLAFEPGTRWHYSNSGYIVLGAIVEAVTGNSYFEYVREHIALPAGMRDTDAYEMDQEVQNRAMGYTHTGLDGLFDPGPRRNNLFLHVVKGGPAGGGFSTVEDLLRFAEALRGHRLLGAAYTELLLAGKVTIREGNQYAYGFHDERVNGIRIVGHGGGFAGINGQLDIYLDRGYTVAVLANYDPPAAQSVAEKLRELITQD
ncbi:MAG TPA: serine hydrolase domain-containing protein [Chloroflexota bacterium]|nr:serine hydrolase domain-containing protein [Chloroflexota bacterium]